MSYTELNKKNLKKDEELRNYINEKPKYTKTVTIAPNEDLWTEFEAHIKRRVGHGKVSRMVNYLVYKWLQNAKTEPVKEWSSEESVVKTLSVDHKLWDDFMQKLREMYSKHKIQSDIINTIIEEYLHE